VSLWSNLISFSKTCLYEHLSFLLHKIMERYIQRAISSITKKENNTASLWSKIVSFSKITCRDEHLPTLLHKIMEM
jgi:hypothetical protein